MQIKLVLCLLVFFKNNFHNKAKGVCNKTRSLSPSLPSITVKWPIIRPYFPSVGQDMVTKLLKMQMLSDDDELAYSPDSAR